MSRFEVVRTAVGAVAVARGAAWLIQSPHPILFAWVALALLLTLGVRPRWTAAVMVAVWVPVVMAGFFAHHFYLLWLMLMLVASGERIGLPLMRFQFSLVYVYAGLAKVNPEFLSGDIFRFLYGRNPLQDPEAAFVPLALGTIALELFIGVAVWTRFRSAAFALMLPLHLGMLTVAHDAADVIGLPLFALLMATLATSFVDTKERIVVWDDGCWFCARWVSAFRRLDRFGSLRFIAGSDPQAYETGVRREDAAAAMQLVRDGRIFGGYDAVREVVRAFPGGIIIAPWMGLPGVNHLGHAAYRRVAARRTCAYVPANA